jgi:beta-lactamase superfamily II metal-dependent hydrolase
MRAECAFHGVGQGLFYSAIIKNKETNFTFVYDCGTSTGKKSAINKSIEDFRNIDPKRIDLLAISHFHKDHISHIPELIKDFEIGTVLLPCVPPQIRLLLASQYDKTTVDLRHLYGDPVGYFATKGAKQIIAFVPPINDEYSWSYFPPQQNPNDILERTDDVENVFQCSGINSYSRHTYHSKNNKLTLDEFAGGFRFNFHLVDWEFSVMNVYNMVSEHFAKHIKAMLDKYDNNFETILRDPTLLKELKGIYKNNFDNLNNTSLIIRHKSTISSRSAICDNNHSGYYPCRYFNSGATVLLGDITLTKKVVERLNETDMFAKEECFILLIPHHGSKHSMCEEFLSVVEKNYVYGNIQRLIISYGIANRYKHPHIYPVYITHRESIKLVNETQSYFYSIFTDD